MRTDRLDYELPEELVAQQPGSRRDNSRLLVLERKSGRITDSKFNCIGNYLKKGDCLVINDTKVLQARFFADRKTGGKLEGLFLEQKRDGIWLVMLKGAGKVKTGESICLKNTAGGDFCRARVAEKLSEGRCLLNIECEQCLGEVLEKVGFVPLPPYIKRGCDVEQNLIDKERYQTVYARACGAVAAPTAGLHFTNELIEELRQKGIEFANVTLHVSAGTFKPVTTETLEKHKMHFEKFSIDEEDAEIINRAKAEGRRIIAVGTTSVRVLETVAENWRVKSCRGETDLFIKEGFDFKIVDGMITNFHLPRSTLLALVSAFAGLDNVFAAYRHAIKEKYRFYSYGDVMLII
ncbi:MAG: tRNA preQ1(34) S-adenosylmethionine ribosyltransferase-isomerase QueA [Sedimentisphaerales bacterium]|nr:tRNA preQ1(34) S-adenosylmethionine ribosyltransferase-isomerase QueA [Sedimentisphaerales bacterium]